MQDWLLCRVPPEIYAAVEAAAADTWQQRADYVRQAIVARLRAEGRLEPRPSFRRLGRAENRAARDGEAA